MRDKSLLMRWESMDTAPKDGTVFTSRDCYGNEFKTHWTQDYGWMHESTDDSFFPHDWPHEWLHNE